MQVSIQNSALLSRCQFPPSLIFTSLRPTGWTWVGPDLLKELIKTKELILGLLGGQLSS